MKFHIKKPDLRHCDRRWFTQTAMVTVLLGASLAFGLALGHQSTAGSDQPIAEARLLVAKMSLDEKLGQLVNFAPAIPRLGIPAYNWWTESLHGLLSDVESTNFPEPVGLAATFDEELVHTVAGAVSEEVRANYEQKRAAGDTARLMTGLDVWAPNINIYRDPRWGRGQETYGEDPYLTSRLGAAYVSGMQGPDPAHPRVIATAKHFAVHSGPESTRHEADVKVSSHDLEDTYLPAFRAAIVDGHAGSVMCAYNAINGVPACANDFLLKTKLRGAWGFQGYVVSDCGAITDISAGHKYAPTNEAGIGAAFRAGIDNECGNFFGGLEIYKRAVERGDLKKVDVDRALVRLFAARYRLGILPALSVPALTSSSAPSLATPGSAVATDEHSALALRAAEEGVVLLKNSGVLPLKASGLKIAVLGPLANTVRVLRGNYSSGRSPPPVSVLQGLRAALPGASIEFVPGAPFAGDLEIVPRTALLTPDGKPGLRLEFFTQPPNLPGDSKPFGMGDSPPPADILPSAKSLGAITTAVVDVDTFFEAAKGLPPSFDAVWTGFLVPHETGLYRVGLKGTGGRMFLDGKELAAVSGMGLAQFGTVHLEAGHHYSVKILSRGGFIFATRFVWNRISDAPEEDAITAAKKADIVVAVVGLNSELEGEEGKIDLPGFRGGDRTSLDIPIDQQRLLEAAKSVGKPLVVVVMSGGALNLAWAKDNADAIIEAWYPGQQGGAAIGRVLSGDVNPAGRLPVTFYHGVEDLPPFEDYAMQNRTYRYYTGKAVYPFGYGLSYTTFTYGPLQLKRTPTGYAVTTTVENTGKIEGDEVAQLYLKFPPIPGAPNLALRGVERVHLVGGERRTLLFSLSARDLSSVTPEGKRRVAAGRYTVSVGGGQPKTEGPFAEAPLRITTAQAITD